MPHKYAVEVQLTYAVDIYTPEPDERLAHQLALECEDPCYAARILATTYLGEVADPWADDED